MGNRVESQQQRTQYLRDAVSKSADYIKISQRGFGGAVTNRLHIIVNQGTTSHNLDVCLRETSKEWDQNFDSGIEREKSEIPFR